MLKDYYKHFPIHDLQTTPKELIEAEQSAVLSRIGADSAPADDFTETQHPTVYAPPSKKRSPLRFVLPIAAAAAAVAVVLPIGARFLSGRDAIGAGSSGVSGEIVGTSGSSGVSAEISGSSGSSSISPDGSDPSLDTEIGTTEDWASKLPPIEDLYVETQYRYSPFTTDDPVVANIERYIISYIGMNVWNGGSTENLDFGEHTILVDGKSVTIDDKTVFKGEFVRNLYVTGLTRSELLFMCSRDEALDETLLLYDYNADTLYRLDSRPAQNIGIAVILEENEPFVYEYEVIEGGDGRLIRFLNRYRLTRECFTESKVPSLADVAAMTDDEVNAALVGMASDEIIHAWGNPDESLSGFYGDIWRYGTKQIILYYDPETDTVYKVHRYEPRE